MLRTLTWPFPSSLAFPVLLTASLGVKKTQLVPGWFLFRDQPPAWPNWHITLWPLARTSSKSGQPPWPAAIPGHRGSLLTTCLQALCNRERAICAQASLTRWGSGVSTPRGPAAGKRQSATCWLWAARPQCLLLQVGTETILSPCHRPLSGKHVPPCGP